MIEPKYAAIVLAAGQARRMGRPKQLLPIGGKPLLVHAVDAVLQSRCFDPLIVVLGANATAIRSHVRHPRIRWCLNEQWAEGLSSSVQAGFAAALQQEPAADGVLFCLADQPRLSATALRRLVEASDRFGQASLVAARYEGHLGAPCLLHPPAFAKVNGLAGDRGLRPLFNQLPEEQIAAVDLPELATDLDTPEDYRGFDAG